MNNKVCRELKQLQNMNSSQGVKTHVRKNRRKRRKKTSNDTEETGHKMKPIVVADFDDHTDCRDLAQLQKMNSSDGVKTCVGKKRRRRRRNASNDSCVGVKEEVSEMKSSGVEEVEKLSLQEELWGHNHAECLKDQELDLELQMITRSMHLIVMEMAMEMKVEKEEEEEKKEEEERKKQLMELDQLLAYYSDEDGRLSCRR